MMWPFPSGRRRPSLRVGLPWLFGTSAWVGMARLAVELEWLRRAELASWLTWLVVQTVLLPAAIVLASAIIGVWPDVRSVVRTALAVAISTTLAILTLYGEFAAFGILGGMIVSAVATIVFVLSTSRGSEAWRDAHLP